VKIEPKPAGHYRRMYLDLFGRELQLRILFQNYQNSQKGKYLRQLLKVKKNERKTSEDKMEKRRGEEGRGGEGGRGEERRGEERRGGEGASERREKECILLEELLI
jgi:hypothetical protein